MASILTCIEVPIRRESLPRWREEFATSGGPVVFWLALVEGAWTGRVYLPVTVSRNDAARDAGGPLGHPQVRLIATASPGRSHGRREAISADIDAIVIRVGD